MSFRDSPFSDIKVPFQLVAGVAVVVCLVVAIGIIVADRRETLEAEAYGTVRATADMIQRPISGAAAAPVGWFRSISGGVGDYFFAVSENRRLRAENRSLRSTHDQVVALQDDNQRLRALLGLKLEPPVAMVSGRSVTDSRGPFANSRLVNVGKEAGVRVGNPVMSENGLVGRVVGVTSHASRILLLTDIASRTPVMIDRNNARAILTGDGGSHPKLAYLRSRDNPKVGDRVLTSGDGGVMPRGLPVGVVVKGVDGAWRVQLASDRAAIDYIRILKFEDFSQLVNMAELAAPVAPADMAGGVVLPPPAPIAVAPSASATATPRSPATAAAPKPLTTPATAAAPRPAAKPAPKPQTRPKPSGGYRRVITPNTRPVSSGAQ